jgi:glycosyltransferase involved in cell wall biosynthesis
MPDKFLSIVTRTYKRPQRLEECKASIAQLTDGDYEHVVVVDEVGAGHDGAYQLCIDAYDAGRMHGQYIWFLDDDDRLADPEFVTRLKETAEEQNDPTVIVVRHQNTKRVWPEDDYWEKVPTRRHIGIGCLIIRSDIWRKYAPRLIMHHYAGDWMMISQMVREKLHREWVWLDMVGTLKGPAGIALDEDELDRRGLVFVDPGAA